MSKESAPTQNLIKGKFFEEQALAFLLARGLVLIERNFHCRRGEIDLIMLHNHDMVFVEVRYRRNGRFGGAALSIDGKKQQKIRLAAQSWLQQNESLTFRGCRFDVIAIEGDKQNLQTQWISDAF